MITDMGSCLIPNDLYHQAFNAIQRGYVGEGLVSAEFLRLFSSELKVPAGRLVLTDSATSGLFAAVGAAGVSGKDVVLPSVCYNGCLHAVLAAGGRPVLCDVNPASLNVNPATVTAALTEDTRLVIVQHHGGAACDSELVQGILPPGVLLLEDAATALATTLPRNSPYRAGVVGDFGVWSFGPVKQISTPSGGAVYCRTAEHAAAVRSATQRGMGAQNQMNVASDWWVADVNTFGYRSSWNDVAAGMAIPQIARLRKNSERLVSLYRRYRAWRGEWIPTLPNGSVPTFCPFSVPDGRRDDLLRFLRANGVYATFRYWPLHRTTLFKRLLAEGKALIPAPLTNSDLAADTVVNLPLHPKLSDGDVDRVCELVDSFLVNP